MTADGFTTVARVGEIDDGGVKLVRYDETPIGVFRLGDAYYALEDVCTHDGGPLAHGIVEGDQIECPRHGARFDIRTGAALTMPAITPVPTYAVRVVGDEIQVGPQGAATTATGAPAASRDARAAAAMDEKPGPVDKPAPSQQEVAVRAALENVMDPEIGLSVIDLGLIREVHFLPEGKTFIRMMLTTPFCPYAPQMMEDVKQATTSVVPQPCEVELMADPWSPDLMPDPGLLGYSF